MAGSHPRVNPDRPVSVVDADAQILSVRHETLCYTELLMKNAHGHGQAITRRETKLGPRFDVEWRLPDRSKRRKSFKTEREARVFEAAIVTKSLSGDVVDPRAGRITLATVYQSWLASRLDLSPKVRRGYEDIWRLRIEARFGGWSVGKIDHQSIQKWVNEMSESGLSPRTLRWVHSVLKMCLDHATDEGQLLS